MSQSFPQAAWLYLSFCEDYFLRAAMRRARGPEHADDIDMLVDSIINHERQPLFWIWRNCVRTGSWNRHFTDERYAWAWGLSRLALDYLPFEAVFTLASRGEIGLRLCGRNIVVERTPFDFQYEAYDRLRRPRLTSQEPAFEELIDDIANVVRVDGPRFFYILKSELVVKMLTLQRPWIDYQFRLPPHWDFGRFSLAQFRSAVAVLTALAGIHAVARAISRCVTDVVNSELTQAF